MSKFMVFSCSNVDSRDTGHNYSGNVAILACANDPSLMLFFPILEENAEILSFILQEDSEIDINTSSLGIYQTMINSWLSLDKYLSGIVMDLVYDPKVEDYIMEVKLAISTKYGALDSVVKVNLVHAILLSVMEGVEIIVTNELLNRLMPDEEFEEGPPMLEKKNGEDKSYPKDQNILKIAKNIMEAEEKTVPTTTTKTTTPKPTTRRTRKKKDSDKGSKGSKSSKK